MTKTTVYLPEELRSRMRRAAEQVGISEAQFIRDALQRSVDEVRPRPRGGLISASTSAVNWESNDHLAGFGDR
ncbi:MAG: antitoxin [Microbacteriaceae bacterium]|nr:antitoxin [Microbacteriaceae bacterium]